MAGDQSFDVVSEFDAQELRNALDQVRREVAQRYDFKGATVELEQGKDELTLVTDDEFRATAVKDLIESKAVRRNLSLKIFDWGKVEPAGGNKVRQKIGLRKGLPDDLGQKLTKLIRDEFPKVKSQIQGDAIRVSGKSRTISSGSSGGCASSTRSCPSSSRTTADRDAAGNPLRPHHHGPGGHLRRAEHARHAPAEPGALMDELRDSVMEAPAVADPDAPADPEAGGRGDRARGRGRTRGGGRPRRRDRTRGGGRGRGAGRHRGAARGRDGDRARSRGRAGRGARRGARDAGRPRHRRPDGRRRAPSGGRSLGLHGPRRELPRPDRRPGGGGDPRRRHAARRRRRVHGRGPRPADRPPRRLPRHPGRRRREPRDRDPHGDRRLEPDVRARRPGRTRRSRPRGLPGGRPRRHARRARQVGCRAARCRRGGLGGGDRGRARRSTGRPGPVLLVVPRGPPRRDRPRRQRRGCAAGRPAAARRKRRSVPSSISSPTPSGR